jgi:hypothetical protein
MFFRYARTPQDAVEAALAMKGGRASVLILPYAVDCVPKLGAS